jgi:hypothetical protein
MSCLAVCARPWYWTHYAWIGRRRRRTKASAGQDAGSGDAPLDFLFAAPFVTRYKAGARPGDEGGKDPYSGP